MRVLQANTNPSVHGHASASNVFLVRTLLRPPPLTDDVADLQLLVVRRSIGVDHRWIEPFQELEFGSIGYTAPLAGSVRRDQGGEDPRRRRGPFAAGHPPGVRQAVGIGSERAVKELDIDGQGHSANSGHVASIALRRFSFGVSLTGSRPQPPRGTPSDAAWSRANINRARVLSTSPSSRASSPPAPSHHVWFVATRKSAPGPQRETAAERQDVRMQSECDEKSAGGSVRIGGIRRSKADPTQLSERNRGSLSDTYEGDRRSGGLVVIPVSHEWHLTVTDTRELS